MKHTVYVWLEPEAIEVYQQSSNVWVAEGSHGGTLIGCEGASKTTAIRCWVSAAGAKDESAVDHGEPAMWPTPSLTSALGRADIARAFGHSADTDGASR
jgi:hypothetical protein